MRWSPSKLLVGFLTLAVLAASCGGGGDGKKDVVEELRETDAEDVEPPERADSRIIGNAGLTLSSNSSSWRRLLGSPDGRGAVVLFVQPNASADRKNIARGDMITEIDGQRVTNAEHAQALLWMAPGDTRTLKFMRRSGREREVEIKGEVLKQDPVVYLNGMIQQNKNDPVLRYIRGGLGTFKSRLDDINVALREDPQFVEAIARKGNLMILASRAAKESKDKQKFAGQALANFHNALDIIPRHPETLTSQSEAETMLGRASQGKEQAQKALSIDGTYAKANAALARAELALKKPANAAGPARAAVELVPVGNLDYYRLLAAVFKGLKRKADCAQTLNAIVPWLKGTKTFAGEGDRIATEAKEDCG